MTSFIPTQPGQGLLRVSLLGPMGIGKTTALRSLCGQLMAGSDVPNLDKAAHSKEFTTVGAEFGEIDLGSGERLQLEGSPGQDRFDFVRRWVLSASIGALLMVDVNDADAVDYVSEMLTGVDGRCRAGRGAFAHYFELPGSKLRATGGFQLGPGCQGA